MTHVISFSALITPALLVTITPLPHIFLLIALFIADGDAIVANGAKSF